MTWTVSLLVLSSMVQISLSVNRGHRAARLGSIWDIILPPKQETSREDIQTNKIDTESQPKSSFKALPLLKTRTDNSPSSTITTSTTQKPKVTVVKSEDGKRKILLKLMDLYHCPRRGVFPIDGDCERFLMCREDSRNDGRIKGKVYRCPKGYLFSSSGARCQPEDSVACHRSQPLASLMQRAISRGDLLLLP